MKDIKTADSFKDLWENCITEEERRNITHETERIIAQKKHSAIMRAKKKRISPRETIRNISEKVR
jgi:hypothetical protein